MFTNDFELPSSEELTVQEINISTPALRAGAFHVGKKCEKQNNEFILCRKEEEDPRKCLQEGKDVTSCALNVFRSIKKACLDEFNQYANCLDKSSRDFEYRHCRNTQAIFDKCVLDNLGIERPEYGYFCEAKVIDTARPKPEKEPMPEFPEPAEPVSDPPKAGTQARYGSRYFWMH